MKLIRLQEQIAENTCIHQDIAQDIIPHMKDGEDIVFSVCRKDNDKEMCLSLSRDNDHIFAKAHISLGLIGFLRKCSYTSLSQDERGL